MKEKTLRYFVPYSNQTGDPYIDDEGNTTLFLDKKVAEKVMNEKLGICRIEEKITSKKEIYTLCYATGSNALVFYSENKPAQPPILLKGKDEIQPGYYNNRLNRNIAKLKETEKADYFYDLKNCRYLIPMRIKDKTKIMYAVAKNQNDKDEYYYLAFSSLTKYNLWTQAKEWAPVEVSFSALYSISHKHSFIINPTGNMLVLSAEQLKAILKGED